MEYFYTLLGLLSIFIVGSASIEYRENLYFSTRTFYLVILFFILAIGVATANTFELI